MISKYQYSLSILFIILFLSCGSDTSTDNNAAPDPSLLKSADLPEVLGKNYLDARKMLTKAGWQPILQKEEVALADGGVAKYGNGKNFWERGFREVESCSGVGEGLCLCRFKDMTGRTLEVTTTGEQAVDDSSHAVVKELSVLQK